MKNLQAQRMRSRARRRGFTLIELIVSLTAGLLISAAAFLMARNATNFFQHEAGITNAQFSAILGFSRLQAELKNAAYLGPSNIMVDEARGTFCGATASLDNGGQFPGMDRLAGIHIIEDGSATLTGQPTSLTNLWTLNSMAPDSIIISGSFDTTEQFSAAAISPSTAGAKTIVLNEVNDGATIRTRLAANRGGASFADIFRVGRIIRVRDREGRYALGVIASVVDNGSNVEITTEATPDLAKKEVNKFCGCSGFCVGAPVNVIGRMMYDLRPVNAAGVYANLYATADLSDPANVTDYHRGSIPQATRSDLVRIELDSTGDVMDTDNDGNPDNQQILAEYAVDLEFGATFQEGTGVVATDFVRQEVGSSVAMGSASRYEVADVPGTSVGPANRPDLIRSIQVKLSTRAHRRDRDFDLTPNMNDGTRYRFNLGTDLGFARMRTLVADVMLPNQRVRIDPP